MGSPIIDAISDRIIGNIKRIAANERVQRQATVPYTPEGTWHPVIHLRITTTVLQGGPRAGEMCCSSSSTAI